MNSQTRRRLGSTLAIALAGVALPGCGAAEPDPAPSFSLDDGLPSELEAGRQYEARVTVTFPADWPEPDETGRSAMVGLTVDLGTGDGPLICATQGLLPQDLPSATLTCRFTPQAPTLGVQLGAHASAADASIVNGESDGLTAEHVYLHTVGS